MGSGKSEFIIRQLAIGVNDAGQRIGIEQLGTDRIVCRGESLIVAFGDRHAGSHGMSAIALQQSRMARIEQYQRIAQMQPRNRTTRARSEEHTSELQSLMRTSYAVFCLKKKKIKRQPNITTVNNK